MSEGRHFKVRAGVVLLQENRLLLARQNNKPFWVLPGGTLEPGEGMAQCAQREMLEETGLSVAIERLLYVSDFIHPTRQTVDVFFKARYVGGTLQMETTENLNEIGWFTREEAQKITLQPAAVSKQLLLDWENGFTENVNPYLGITLP